MVDKKKNKGTLKKVFSYIGKYKYFLILSILFWRLSEIFFNLVTIFSISCVFR